MARAKAHILWTALPRAEARCYSGSAAGVYLSGSAVGAHFDNTREFGIALRSISTLKPPHR
jgi:hypothetical protein